MGIQVAGAAAGLVTGGGLADTVAASTGVINAEAVLKSDTAPANSLRAGTAFRINAYAQSTVLLTPGNAIFRIRIGPTTLTGTIASSVTAAMTASLSNKNIAVNMMAVIRTAGAGGTAIGAGSVLGDTAGAFTNVTNLNTLTATVAVDTTVSNLVEFTAITGAADATITFQTVNIELVQA